jgi:hypothetical protein
MADATEASKKKNRSFKVKLTTEGDLYGRYNGDSPYQAANKALSEIIRTKVKNNESIDSEINFYLVESTKGSKKKSHQYIGKRVQLDTPVIYKVGEQEIVKNFKNILKKVKRINESDSETNTKKTKVSKPTKTPKTTKKVVTETTKKVAKKVTTEAAKKVEKVEKVEKVDNESAKKVASKKVSKAKS